MVGVIRLEVLLECPLLLRVDCEVGCDDCHNDKEDEAKIALQQTNLGGYYRRVNAQLHYFDLRDAVSLRASTAAH